MNKPLPTPEPVDDTSENTNDLIEAWADSLQKMAVTHDPAITEAACIKLIKTAFDKRLRLEVVSENDHEYVLKALMKVLGGLYPRKRKMNISPEESARRSKRAKEMWKKRKAKEAREAAKSQKPSSTSKPSKTGGTNKPKPSARYGNRR